MSDYTIRDADALQARLGPVAAPSVRKEVPFLHPVYQEWLRASPFAVVATSGPGGLDVSPRGDAAPLLRVADPHTVLLPERRGNNRADGLRNLLTDPRVSVLSFVPGVDETLRINGTATMSVDPDLLQSFAVHGALPTCVVVIRVETVYFQCARALLRSGLWTPAAATDGVPSAGTILAALTNHEVGGDAYDRELPARLRTTLY